MQQTCKYKVLCSIFPRVSIRTPKSEKTYKPANEHAIKLGKLIEELSSLEMDGNKNEKKNQYSLLVKPAKGKGLKSKRVFSLWMVDELWNFYVESGGWENKSWKDTSEK